MTHIDQQKLLDTLNAMRCSVHGEKPNAELEGAGIKFSYCCAEFNEHVEEKINELTESISNQIISRFFGDDMREL